MADVMTPSSAAIGTIDARASTPTGSNGKAPAARPEKPEKPDEEQFKQDLAKAEKEHSMAIERLNKIKAKLDLAKPAKDSPSSKRQQELRAELASIRQQQQGLKGNRNATMDKIKRLDEQLKSRMNEHKVARSRVSYKNVEEVDREIERLQKQVDTGTMKLVDEKKALADISQLHKQRKGFAGFEQAQKGIDDVKAQIAELRKQLDDPEFKALSDRYTTITKELDEIRAEQDEAYKNLNNLRDERTKAQNEQQEKYSTIREIKDKYFQAKRAYADYEREAYLKRKERQKAERDAYEAGKRRQIANQKLEEASAPAYSGEIQTAEGLIRYFDPSAVAAKSTSGPGKFAAAAQRTVDDSGIKGTRLARKDEAEENYFMGGGGKKGKKGRKGNNGAAASPSGAPAAEGKFNLPVSVIEQLGEVNIEPPMAQADVPAVVEKLKERLEFWKGDQDRKTKENIAKAQKEIDRLEAEATNSPAPNGSSQNTEAKPSASDDTSKPSANGATEESITKKMEESSLDSTNGEKKEQEKDDEEEESA